MPAPQRYRGKRGLIAERLRRFDAQVPVRKSRARLLPGKGGSLLFVATPVSVAHGKRGFYWLRRKFPPTILALEKKIYCKGFQNSKMVTWKDDHKRYI